MRLLNSILHGLNAAPGPPAWLMPGGVHMWRGDVLGLTGANVNTATDQIGTLTIASAAVKPTTVILPGASARRGWRGAIVGGAQFLSGDPALPEVMASGSVAYVVLVPAFLPGGAPMIYVTAGLAGAPGTDEISEFHIGLAPPNELGRKDAGGVADVVGPVAPLGVLYDCIHTWTGGVEELYRDGVLIAAAAIVQPTANVQRWCIAGSAAHAFGFPSSVQYGEARTGNVKLGLADAAAFHAYRLAYYG
jgi:hypothetical protein